MTTLIVQTAGTPVADANTYLDVSSSDTLATKYGYTTWLTAVGDKTVALFQAGRFLESEYPTSFRGFIQENDQAMSFPRTQFYKADGRLVAEGVIPEELTVAQLKLAMLIKVDGIDLFAPPSTESNLKVLAEEVVEGVKRTREWFSPNFVSQSNFYEIGQILLPILNSSGSRTVRA